MARYDVWISWFENQDWTEFTVEATDNEIAALRAKLEGLDGTVEDFDVRVEDADVISYDEAITRIEADNSGEVEAQEETDAFYFAKKDAESPAKLAAQNAWDEKGIREVENALAAHDAKNADER